MGYNDSIPAVSSVDTVKLARVCERMKAVGPVDSVKLAKVSERMKEVREHLGTLPKVEHNPKKYDKVPINKGVVSSSGNRALYKFATVLFPNTTATLGVVSEVMFGEDYSLWNDNPWQYLVERGKSGGIDTKY